MDSLSINFIPGEFVEETFEVGVLPKGIDGVPIVIQIATVARFPTVIHTIPIAIRVGCAALKTQVRPIGHQL